MTVSAKLVVTALVTVLVIGVSVKARQAVPNDSGSALLAEVRAMRTELRDAAANSMRAQLLVARLSLEEQRLTVLHRELVDLQTQLAAATRERLEAERHLQEMTEAAKDPGVSAEMRREIEGQVGGLTRVATAQREAEQQLRLRESEMLAGINGEQARWSDFNARLDELERTLSGARR